MQVTPSHTFEDFSSLCEIVCTSQKTLLAHAAGAPHRKKVKRQALNTNSPKEEEVSKVKKCEKSVTESNVKKSEKRQIQKELGLKILKKYGPKLTTKKFIKKFNKRTRDRPELASDIIKRVRI